eukprot:1159764-Pelagomonas_calceolata.AAC.7
MQSIPEEHWQGEVLLQGSTNETPPQLGHTLINALLFHLNTWRGVLIIVRHLWLIPAAARAGTHTYTYIHTHAQLECIARATTGVHSLAGTIYAARRTHPSKMVSTPALS